MQYFLTEKQRKQGRGAYFFEFQKRSEYTGKRFLEDSLYLHGSIFDDLDLDALFCEAIPTFSIFMGARVTPEQWEKLLLLSRKCGGIRKEVISELIPWVEECFKTEKAFVIYGM